MLYLNPSDYKLSYISSIILVSHPTILQRRIPVYAFEKLREGSLVGKM